MVSLAVQKLLSLIRFHLFIFAFISTALGDWLKKTSTLYLHCLLGVLWCCVSYLSLQNILKLLLCTVRGCVLISLIYMQLSNFPSTFAEETFSHCVFLAPLWRLIDHRCEGLFMGSLFCSIDPYVWVFFFFWFVCLFLVPVPHCFDYWRFVVLYRLRILLRTQCSKPKRSVVYRIHRSSQIFTFSSNNFYFVSNGIFHQLMIKLLTQVDLSQRTLV